MKATIKNLLGDLPLTAEAYWYLRQRGKPTGGFSFRRFQAALPGWCEQAMASPLRRRGGKHVLLFATLRYWLEHTALLGLALAGMGHQVTLAYLPYANWQKPLSRFDLRRQDAYIKYVFKMCEPLMTVVSFLDMIPGKVNGGEIAHSGGISLTPDLLALIERTSLEDTQYTQQIEEVDQDSKLYRLRLERNTQAALAATRWLEVHRPQVVILPSGSILEFAAVYHVARRLGIPAVTYEFGEQRQRIWFSLNNQIMRQETEEMWAAYQDKHLSTEQWERIRALYRSRQDANLWENFSRRWQGKPSEGGECARAALGLDDRPIVLLAANVIGDSLTLGRQIFSENMTEWLVRTTRFFERNRQAQLVVRIHPGERYTSGPSVAQVIQQAFGVVPDGAKLAEERIPENIHLVAADAPINTYDLIQIADLGLVYTTTVGMEAAMSGVPVIVTGRTHYRNKGFTLDPNSWNDYFSLLLHAVEQPPRYRLSQEQVERAWHYAYRFFFDFPLPFPWHLLYFWEDVEEWPLKRVLSDDGMVYYAETFRCLTGEERRWE